MMIKFWMHPSAYMQQVRWRDIWSSQDCISGYDGGAPLLKAFASRWRLHEEPIRKKEMARVFAKVSLCHCSIRRRYLHEITWRYEGKVKDYNFGSLIRTNCEDEYGQDNSIFGIWAYSWPFIFCWMWDKLHGCNSMRLRFVRKVKGCSEESLTLLTLLLDCTEPFRAERGYSCKSSEGSDEAEALSGEKETVTWVHWFQRPYQDLTLTWYGTACIYVSR